MKNAKRKQNICDWNVSPTNLSVTIWVLKMRFPKMYIFWAPIESAGIVPTNTNKPLTNDIKMTKITNDKSIIEKYLISVFKQTVLQPLKSKPPKKPKNLNKITKGTKKEKKRSKLTNQNNSQIPKPPSLCSAVLCLLCPSTVAPPVVAAPSAGAQSLPALWWGRRGGCDLDTQCLQCDVGVGMCSLVLVLVMVLPHSGGEVGEGEERQAPPPTGSSTPHLDPYYQQTSTVQQGEVASLACRVYNLANRWVDR